MFKSPIGTRYSAPVLSEIWNDEYKIKKMRELWINLAKAQKYLGITSITDIGIQEMTINKDNINFESIQIYEERFKHDIVANIHVFGDLCPNAKSFIHLGATSNFINDNVDIIRIRESLILTYNGLLQLFNILKELSFKYNQTPTIGYTHLQNGQLTTIGKRFTMWNSDIYQDLLDLKACIMNMSFRGIKGTVGTEDSIYDLFDKNSDKCRQLNSMLTKEYGFDNNFIICGQTYSRKYDVKVIQCISSISQSIYKIMNDFRLLSSKDEIYEFFGEDQVGSSAMPYKKNPITCEKICSLARYIINNETNIVNTYINQWLERSLDDSAIKRIILPESFLLLEHIITESVSIFTKCFINVDHINLQIQNHMVMIISERIIINGVKLGYNRQDIHERLRQIFINLGKIKIDELNGLDDVITDIINNSKISFNPEDYTGRCTEQIQEFYANCKL